MQTCSLCHWLDLGSFKQLKCYSAPSGGRSLLPKAPKHARPGPVQSERDHDRQERPEKNRDVRPRHTKQLGL